jgi:hypothetical protein
MRSKVDIAIVGLIAAAAACGARSSIGYVARRRETRIVPQRILWQSRRPVWRGSTLEYGQ